MKVFPIPTDHLVDWWEKVAPMLKQVAEESDGRYTLRSLAEGCGSGDFQMWAITEEDEVKATALTRWLIFPTGQRRGEVIVVTGIDLDDWIDLVPDFKKQFEEMFNLDRVSAWARPGWSRVMRNRGWKASHVLMECVDV